MGDHQDGGFLLMGKVAQQVNDQLARFIVKVSRGLTGQDERGGCWPGLWRWPRSYQWCACLRGVDCGPAVSGLWDGWPLDLK